MRADAFDHAAAQVLLDALEGAGRHDLQEGRLELDAVLSVGIPPAAGLDELPRLDRCGRPEDGHEVTMASNFDPEDAEACVRAVECDTFDQTGKGFAIRGGDVGDQAIHDAQSSTVDPAVPAYASGETLLTGELRYTLSRGRTRLGLLGGTAAWRFHPWLDPAGRHRLLEAGVSGLVDDAHPAAAELGDDRIRPEGSAGREGHGEAILLLDSWRAGNMWGRVDVRVDARPRRSLPLLVVDRPLCPVGEIFSSSAAAYYAVRTSQRRPPPPAGRPMAVGRPVVRRDVGDRTAVSRCSVRTTELNEDCRWIG